MAPAADAGGAGGRCRWYRNLIPVEYRHHVPQVSEASVVITRAFCAASAGREAAIWRQRVHASLQHLQIGSMLGGTGYLLECRPLTLIRS